MGPESRARQAATQTEDVGHSEASQVGDGNAWSDARQAGWGSRKQDAKHGTDWACSCGAVNGYGTQCRSCQAWHPWRWECKCGEINWHDKKQCRLCEAPHPDASVEAEAERGYRRAKESRRQQSQLGRAQGGPGEEQSSDAGSHEDGQGTPEGGSEHRAHLWGADGAQWPDFDPPLQGGGSGTAWRTVWGWSEHPGRTRCGDPRYEAAGSRSAAWWAVQWLSLIHI